ncbi:DUF3298 and DUF4163 domain-containing protein [Rufibacter quisquiliarum]|uniref:DUF3298 domain-containing protein n=1 Tax=Rufibacter quisquiliarum TaxID=1549639 RepID=A0A839GII0_9BACT|nr:DUF3298 and DUF4163 domain-containing protein [Rufibacter quisquiliarum]MBA9078430.1 hypothetical protein [Rufibacter quisquiliarum]
MMTKYLSVLLLLVGGLMFSCQSKQGANATGAAETPAPQAGTSQALAFQPQSVVRRQENCPGDSCATVDLQYLVARGGPTPLRDSLNQYVQDFLLRLQLTNNPDADLSPQENAAEAVATVFLQEQAAFRKEFPDAGARAGWYLKVAMEPVHQTPALVSLQLQSEGYSGGAHGYAVTTLQSFDSTGHALRLHELAPDTVQLRKLVEQEFRNVRQLGAESFEQQGFYTQNGHLPFPQNAALTPKGLLLYYNAYEVNAYAFGPTQLLLPYAQINQLLAPRFRPQP